MAEWSEERRAAHAARMRDPDVRAKISRGARGRPRGPHSAETRRKISAARTGCRHTPESKRKMSLAKTGARNPMHGRTHTAEARQRIAEGQHRRWERERGDG